MNTIQVLIVISVPLLAALIVYLFKTNGDGNGTFENYFYGPKSLRGEFAGTNNIGTNITFTSIFLILSAEGFLRGNLAFAIPVFWCAGTVIIFTIYHVIFPFIRDRMTLHQAIGHMFNSTSIKRFSGVATVIAFISTVGLEMYGGSLVLSWAGISGVGTFALFVVVGYLVFFVINAGGIRGVTYADWFLNLLTLITLGFLCWYVIQSAPNGNPFPLLASAQFVDSSADIMIYMFSMLIIFLPFQLCTLDTWQRFCITKKIEHRPKWYLVSGLLVGLAFCVPISVGILAKISNLSASPDGSPLKAVIDVMNLTPWLKGIVLAGFMAAMVSTADQLLNSACLSWFTDVLGLEPTKNKDPIYQRRIMSSVRLYLAIFVFLALMIAFIASISGQHIVDLAIAIFSTQVVFTWPLIVGWAFPKIAPKLARPIALTIPASFILSIGVALIGWGVGDKEIVQAAPIVAFIFSGVIVVGSFVHFFIRGRLNNVR